MTDIQNAYDLSYMNKKWEYRDRLQLQNGQTSCFEIIKIAGILYTVTAHKMHF